MEGNDSRTEEREVVVSPGQVSRISVEDRKGQMRTPHSTESTLLHSTVLHLCKAVQQVICLIQSFPLLP